MLSMALLVAATAPADLAAVGVVFGPRPELCVAILRSAGRTRIAGLDETVFGGRVAAVTPAGVVVEYEGGRVELRLPQAPSSPAAAPAPVAEPAEAGAEAPRTLARVEVEQRLAGEIPRILAETALVPAFEDGRLVGLRLTRLAQGTLLTDAGLRTGDVLVEVNGTAIDGIATLVSLWPRLQGERELRARVLRDGRPLSVMVTLR